MTGDSMGDGRLAEHPGAELSALLDGELAMAAAQEVHAHLRICPACAEELAWVRAARWSLRSLPPVEPPPGFVDLAVTRVNAEVGDGTPRPDDAGDGAGDGLDGLAPVLTLDRRRRGRAGAASAAAVAAAVALFALTVVGAEPSSYLPAVDTAIGRHVASLTALSAGGSLAAVDGGADPLRTDQPVTATTAPRRDPHDLPAPFLAPARLDGDYRLVDAFTHPEGLQLVYRSGRYGLSVFEAPGELDVASLPALARPIDVGGVAGWRWESDEFDGRVVVFQREGLVITVIGDEPGEAVTEAAGSVPGARPRSMAERLGHAGARVLEVLSP